jgi:hypothetical protein
MDLDNQPPGKSAASGLQAQKKSSKIQRCSLAKAGKGDVLFKLTPEG